MPLAEAVGEMRLSIKELYGSDDRNSRPRTQFAALPAVATAPKPPGPKRTGRDVVRRYVVVEETGTFYLPTSPLLEGQRGVALTTTADDLSTLGFKAASDIKF